MSVYHYDPANSRTAGTLRELGIDTEYYEAYTNDTERMHGVDVILLSCVFEGRGVHYLDEFEHREDGSSLSVVTYGIKHDIVTETPMQIMNLFLDPVKTPLPPVPAALQSTLTQLIPIHPEFSNRAVRAVRVPLALDANVKRLLRLLHDEIHSQAVGYESVASDLLSVLLTHVCRLAIDNGVTRARSDDRLEHVAARLTTEFARPLSLDELAESAGMSKPYLCRKFKEYTGKTVFGYLLDRRFEVAMQRLHKTDMTIASIALDSGFSDIGFFNRKFKERFGTTPGEYRRRGRQQ